MVKCEIRLVDTAPCQSFEVVSFISSLLKILPEGFLGIEDKTVTDLTYPLVWRYLRNPNKTQNKYKEPRLD